MIAILDKSFILFLGCIFFYFNIVFFTFLSAFLYNSFVEYFLPTYFKVTLGFKYKDLFLISLLLR